MSRNIPKKSTVLVVGGGPAGSTIATLLSRNGTSVVVLERETFPRYHIGESLLPSCLEIFDLLGVREKIERHGFVRKPGAYLHWGTDRWSLRFGELRGRHTYSFQVKRSEFDKLLLDHAMEQGALVFQGVQVMELEFSERRPTAAVWKDRSTMEAGRVEFDFLIDATGRAGLMATNYLKNRRHNELFQNVAIWGYWTGVEIPNDGLPGEIVVGSIPEGWIWAIPLQDGTTSLGVVMDKRYVASKRTSTLSEIYNGAIAGCKLITTMLSHASLDSPLKAEQDYSYSSEKFTGPGYFILGDAACFLDPLLSSGVHLATYSALLSAAAIGAILRRDVSEEEAVGFFEKSYRQAYLRFLVMVATFYDQRLGKENYWEKARELSRDCSSNDLKGAFINLVSGMRDLADMQEGVPDAVAGHMKAMMQKNITLRKDKDELKKLRGDSDEAVQNQRFFDEVEGLTALSSHSAVDGLYVVTEPRLGLARVGRSENPNDISSTAETTSIQS